MGVIGPNKIVERPVCVADSDGGERLEKRKLMNVSTNCGHRVVGGWDAASSPWRSSAGSKRHC